MFFLGRSLEPPLQRAEDRAVRLGHRELLKRRRGYPLERPVAVDRNRARRRRHDEGVEPQPAIGVVVDEDEERFRVVRDQARFLAKLPQRRRLRFFVRFHLAARKLPGPCQVLAVAAARDENVAVFDDDRERDVEAAFRMRYQAGAPGAPAA